MPRRTVPRPAAVPRSQPPSVERKLSHISSIETSSPPIYPAPGKIHQHIVGAHVGPARQTDAVAKPEGVLHNLRLLLDAVPLEKPCPA